MMESSVEDLLDRCSVDEMEESPEENEKWGQSSSLSDFALGEFSSSSSEDGWSSASLADAMAIINSSESSGVDIAFRPKLFAIQRN